MIGSTRSIRVFAYTAPTDMRKGFDGLYGMVQTELDEDPLSGDMFLFVSRDRRRAKVLVWDGTGLCLYSKRLERGRFAKLWGGEGSCSVRLTTSELALFLEGSKLVGKVAVSPEELCFKCLTHHKFGETIQHAKAGEYQGPEAPPAGGISPRKDGRQTVQGDCPTAR